MVISAVLASIVGTAYVRYLTFADPYLLISPVITIEIVLFATVGGLGRAYGPALGALLLVPLGEVLRGKLGSTLPGLHYFIYGVVVIARHPGHAARAVATGRETVAPADIWLNCEARSRSGSARTSTFPQLVDVPRRILASRRH